MCLNANRNSQKLTVGLWNQKITLNYEIRPHSTRKTNFTWLVLMYTILQPRSRMNAIGYTVLLYELLSILIR